MVSCLMGDSTALASAIVRCCPKERILKHLQSRLPNATKMQLEKIIKG